MAGILVQDGASAQIDGACDCHIHVYEQGYPLAASATFRPPHAPLSAYKAVQRALGLSRAVLIQPTAYGFDNRCMLAALGHLGDCARGIAILPPQTDESVFGRLHRGGVRGLRYIMLPGGVLSWDSLPEMAARGAVHGWHINLQLDGRELPEYQALLGRLPGRLVIDHTGKFLEPVAPDSAAFKALCGLLDTGRCWVKLSAPYETSRTGPPGYEDVARLAAELARRYPQRCLWASNWPHPNTQPVPDTARLLAWFKDLCGNEAAWRRICIDNPAELYGF